MNAPILPCRSLPGSPPGSPPEASRRRLAATALLLACAGLVAAASVHEDSAPEDVAVAPAPWDLAHPAPVAGKFLERLDGVEDLACNECHAEIVDEWAQTLHALAWVDEWFQEDLADKRKPESCHGCHIPEPLLAAGVPRKPEARADELRLGVWCATCHLGPDGETIHGPWGLEHDAHASVRDPLFSEPAESELCIACHATNIGPVIGIAKDFEMSEHPGGERSCVGCHMAPVERVLDSVLDDSGRPARRMGRSHALQTPRDPTFLRRAFAISARNEGARTIVRFENRAGHRAPGLIGRRYEFRLRLLDEAGERLETLRLELDHRAYLPVDDAREVAFEATGASVRITGRHVDPRLDDPTEFLDEVFTPGG